MANKYRVANGNRNASNTWALTSGGTDYTTTPTSSDDCFFDANTPNGTHTINATAPVQSLDFTGFTGTITGSSQLSLYGNLKVVSGMTRTATGVVAIKENTTIISAGKTIGSIFLDTANKTLTLGDNLTCLALYTNITTTTLVTGGYDLIMTQYNQNGRLLPSISGNFNILSITSSSVKTNVLSILSNFTTTGNLTINGNSAINRLLIKSSTLGTQRTITCNGTITVTNADFQDIKGAGSGSWDLSGISGGSGDCGGNTDIIFTTAINCYGKFSANANWSASNWYTTSGGATLARVPLPQDTAIIDGNSGSRVLTQDMPRIGSVNFTGSSGMTWTTDTECSVFGSINLTDLGTLTASTQTYIFEGRGSNTLTSAGKTWVKSITINSPGGTLTLGDKFETTGNTVLNITAGTFTTDNNNIIVGNITSSNSNVRTINFGSSLIEINFTSNYINFSTATNLTFNCGTSTIKLTATLDANRSFIGGGQIFYNVWNATTGDYIVTVTGSNTFNDFKINAGRKQNFTTGTTTTVNTFTAVGEVGNLITIRSSTTTNATLTKAGGGVIDCDYIDIDYMTGNPDLTWYMGDNSTDGGHNSQIYFTTSPTPTATGNMFLVF